MPKQPYEDHCTDCMLLPNKFPALCAVETAKNLRTVFAGQPVQDAKCAVHCALTLLGWGAGLWINSDPHPPHPMQSKATEPPDMLAGAVELDRCCSLKEGEGMQALSINWGKILAAAAKLLAILIPLVDPQPNQ